MGSIPVRVILTIALKSRKCVVSELFFLPKMPFCPLLVLKTPEFRILNKRLVISLKRRKTGVCEVTANHPQPMTKLAKNDIITLKANRNLKGVRYHGKNTRDKKAGASQR
ncbi:MAG: hypothetical protein K6C68_09490, partial [Ruminococcus sp.]|nr:hypothetical protein [Ruminococcus sp.]